MENSESVNAKTLGNAAIMQAVAAAVKLFSGLLFYLVAIRVFSQAYVGAIALFVGIIGLLSLIFSLGLGRAVQHFSSYYIGKGDFGTTRKVIIVVVKLGIGSAIGGLFILFILSNWISFLFFHSEIYSSTIKLLSVDLLGYVLFEILNGILLGTQNFYLSAKINIIVWIVYYVGAIFLIIFVKELSMVIIGWIFGIFIGVFLELIFIVKILLTFKEESENTYTKTILYYSIPIALTTVITFGATYADRFVVAGVLSLAQLGVYNIALLVSTSLIVVIVPFNNILLPKFSEWYAKGLKSDMRTYFQTASLLLYSIYAPITLFVVSASSLIITLLAGKQYISGSIPLDIVTLSSGICIEQYMLVQVLYSIKRTKFFLWSSGTALSANVVISIILTRIWGLTGASVGLASVYFITFFLLLWYAGKFYVIKNDIGGIAKIWFASGILAFPIHFFFEFNHFQYLILVSYVFLGSFAYIFVLRKFNVFTKESKEILYRVFFSSNKKIQVLMKIFIGL